MHSLLELPLLGLPVRFEAEDPAALDAVLAAYGEWRGLAAHPHLVPAPGEAPSARVRLRLRPPPPGGPPLEDAPPQVAVTGSRLLLAAPGARAEAELATSEASAVLDPRILADPARLRADVLDTLLLFLLTRRDRQPLHAAAVVHAGTAAVLAGPGGTGKSSLAWAAARAGLRVLSDDAVYLQLQPRLRVWGFDTPLHLLPDAAGPIPEGVPLRERGGRLKAAIPLPRDGSEPPVVERAVLCLLEPGGRRVSLQRIDPDGAIALLAESWEPGFDVFRDTLLPPLRALARAGAWRLRLSADPDEAIAAVRAVLGA
ncbi:MAG TPA: hypothetical protein VFQ38_12595 [Longimicrobiales bacterium]|nr:hypothetical protein [Longimicrobiales bacterium]